MESGSSYLMVDDKFLILVFEKFQMFYFTRNLSPELNIWNQTSETFLKKLGILSPAIK
jgi:hypothetical protein